MISTTIDSKTRLGGALLAMAIATGVSTAAIGAAPAANATCASFFGLGNTANCSSGFGSIAIAIGSDGHRPGGRTVRRRALGGRSELQRDHTGSAFTLASAMGTGAAAYVNGILRPPSAPAIERRSRCRLRRR